MPLTMPTAPKIRRCRFQLQSNTKKFVSPYDRTTQVAELPGGRWTAYFEYPPMTEAQAAEWIAFLAECDGMAGTFYAGDPACATPRGSALGVPYVSGGGQTGKSLDTWGWDAGEDGVLLKYDMFHFATLTGWQQMHTIVNADVDADSGGLATLSIRPAIRESPSDGTPIIISNPQCIMSLVSDDAAVWEYDMARIYGIRFQAMEVFA